MFMKTWFMQSILHQYLHWHTRDHVYLSLLTLMQRTRIELMKSYAWSRPTILNSFFYLEGIVMWEDDGQVSDSPSVNALAMTIYE